MVVIDRIARLGDELGHPERGGGVPDLFDHGPGVVERIMLLVDIEVGIANQIQQDAEARPEGGNDRAGEMLRAPGIARFGSLQPLILRIKKDDVDPAAGRLLTNQAGDFQQDGHTGCAVVGAEDGLAVVGRIRVLVRPGPGVPVGAEQDPLPPFRLEVGDDIGGPGRLGGLAEGVDELLGGHLGGIAAQDGDQIVAAAAVAGAARHPRPEIALLLEDGVGPGPVEGGRILGTAAERQSGADQGDADDKSG